MVFFPPYSVPIPKVPDSQIFTLTDSCSLPKLPTTLCISYDKVGICFAGSILSGPKPFKGGANQFPLSNTFEIY
jgi:hypothetical protein